MKKVSLVMWLVFVFVITLNAEEIALRKANDVILDQFSFRTADNCEIMFWSDLDSSNRDIRCQKIGSQGQLVWEEPVTIVNNPGDQRLVDVVPTSDNNFIILWEEYEIDDANEIRLQKVTSNGMKLWGENGIVVTDQINYGDYKLVPNATGGTFIIYRPSYNSLYMGQNFDAFGNRLWQLNGITLVPGTSYQGLRNAVVDGSGGFILNLAIHNGTQMVCNLLRFSATGTPIGNNPLIPTNTIPGGEYQISESVNGEYIIHNINNDDAQVLIANKINANGDLLLAQNITYHVTGYDYFVIKNLVPTPAGGMAILEVMGIWDGAYAMKLQRFNASLVPEWGSEGVLISDEDFDTFGSSIKPSPDGKIWLSWTGSYEDHFVKAQVINPNGTPVWEFNGKLLANTFAYPITIAFADRGVFLWNSTQDGMKKVAMQSIGLNGALSYPPGGYAIDESLNGLCYIGDTYRIGEKFITLWVDGREGDAVYYQISSANGEALLEEGGRRLSPVSEGWEYLNTAQPTLDGKLAVIYTHQTENNGEYPRESYLQVIDQSGETVYPDSGIELDVDFDYINSAYIACNPDGIYLGWTKYNVGPVNQIMGQKIVDGVKLWGENGKVIASAPILYNIQLQGIAGRYYIWHILNPEGDESYVRTLMVNQNGDPETGWETTGVEIVHDVNFDNQNIQDYSLVGDDLVSFISLEKQGAFAARAQKINSAGQRLWTATGTNISGETGSAWVLDAVYGEVTAFLTQDDITSSDTTISFRRITANGTVLVNDEHIVIPSTNNCYDASLVKFANGSYLCAYSDNDGALIQNRDAFMRFISPEGAPLGDAATVLCGERYQQDYIRVAAIGNKALVTWADDRAGIMNSEEAYTGIWGNLITSNYTATDDPLENPLPVASLKGNYPNPFNPSTTISFELRQTGRASLSVYNLKGQLVKVLIDDAVLEQGTHNAVWDGTDASGRGVGSGVYFTRLSFGNESFSRKMLLTK